MVFMFHVKHFCDLDCGHKIKFHVKHFRPRYCMISVKHFNSDEKTTVKHFSQGALESAGEQQRVSENAGERRPYIYVCRQHVDFLVLLRRLSMGRNRNSPAAQTVDFCPCYARKTAKIFLIVGLQTIYMGGGERSGANLESSFSKLWVWSKPCSIW